MAEVLTPTKTKHGLIASDRVEARYGMPCSLALGQLARLEAAGQAFSARPDARVSVESFDE